ncbi:MAG: iron-sulfur cluster assembly scaffold protein [Candidatus Parvarchaeota archaeon]|nr:iron-sulfur cluster assembly scaffold protein [Candidatus Parvarchaeota archaeon]
MDEEKYYEFVDLYKNPEHFGKLKEFDISEEDYSSSCGDRFNVYLKIEKDKIKDASFEGSGCIISTVSVSKVCGYILGKSLTDVKGMGLEDVKKIVGVNQISISRIPCAMIGLETIKKALNSKNRQ